MPVQSTHPVYDAWLTKASKTRLAVQGEDAVKEAGETYLPKIGETKAEYEAYKNRAEYAGFSRRAKHALMGTLLRKPVTINIPPVLDYMKQDCTFDGVGLALAIQNTVDNVMDCGRHGGLVEMDDITQKAFIALYTGESMINWAVQKVRINEINATVLSLMVLKEDGYVQDEADPFKQVLTTRFRVLRLETIAPYKDPVYVQRVFKKGNQVNEYVNSDTQGVDFFVPTMKGKPLNYIPFVVFNSTHNLPHQTEDSMLLDMVNINFKHYMKSADLNHGEHFTCLPTYWRKGVNNQIGPVEKNINGDGKSAKSESKAPKFVIGSSKMIDLPASAEVGVLEVAGAGLERVAKHMLEMEDRIAAISARMIVQGSEKTATAENIRSFGEQATLSALAHSIENGWKQLLVIAAEWMGANSEEVSVTFERNFVAPTMTQNDVAALFKNYLDGGIDLDTYIHNLRKGEVVPDAWDDKSLRTELEDLKAKKAEAADAAQQALIQGVNQMDSGEEPNQDTPEE